MTDLSMFLGNPRLDKHQDIYFMRIIVDSGPASSVDCRIFFRENPGPNELALYTPDGRCLFYAHRGDFNL